MISELLEIPLAEIVSIKGGKRLPAGKNLQSIPSDHPYIRVRDVGQRRLPREGIEYVPDEVFPSISRYIVEENDIVLSIVGTIGALSIVDGFYNGASLTENCVKLTGLDYHDALFLYYYLISDVGQQEIFQGTVGAVQSKLPIYSIEKIKVLWPCDKEERQKIASLLGGIDDKIELNRCINQTLECMAQAIFKSWFVDFDPIKAKLEAKKEGGDPLRAAMGAISGKSDAELGVLMPEQFDQLAATVAMFPDEMEDSELGVIPKGWTPKELSAVCELNASSWSAKTLPDSVRYVDLANTKNGEVIEVQTVEGSSIPGRARRILAVGDTIVGTVRPGNRSFALVGEANLTGSTGFAVLHPRTDFFREYVYLAATSNTNIERLAHLADGGAYPAVRPELVVSDILPIPPEELALEFHRISFHMFERILENRKESRNLAELRDALIPELIAAELPAVAIAEASGDA